MGTAIILMAGHRNLSFYTTEYHETVGLETSNLGFNHWVRAVQAATYNYDLPTLSSTIASYWGCNQDTCKIVPPIAKALS